MLIHNDNHQEHKYDHNSPFEMQATLVREIKKYLPKREVHRVEKAFILFWVLHEGQKRKSGHPFVVHLLETALFLASLELDPEVLIAGLGHDCLEDAEITLEELSARLVSSGIARDCANSSEIVQIIDAVTKVSAAEGANSGQNRDASSERAFGDTHIKLLAAAIIRDDRVLFVKIGDRLHNMRTIQYMSPAKRVEISQETLDIYVPLAERLGLWEAKREFEDLSFQQLNPEGYEAISRRLNSEGGEREAYIVSTLDMLRRRLANAHIGAKVSAKSKHIYSIHKKIAKYQAKNKTSDDIHDLFALRVIVNDVQECYAALGVVHTLWQPVPGEFDDYIANPKANLYQSIHTTVIAEDGHPIEIQIRTHDMQSYAEYGRSKHWRYQDGGKPTSMTYEDRLDQAKSLLDFVRER